jgi:cytochrome c-type biogenesis protein
MILDEFLNNFSSVLSSASWMTPFIAMIGGVLASSVCPCTLPMGLGMAGVISANETEEQKSGFFLALAFFFGIVINLTILGALAGRLGGILTESFGEYWALSMAVFSFCAALFSFSRLRFKEAQLAAIRTPGVVGSFIYGFIFSLGTSAAPFLLLVGVAAAQGEVLYGVTLSFFFGIGRGLPFLLVGVFSPMIVHLAKLSHWQRALRVISGLGLLAVGGYYARVYVLFLSV